MGEGREQDDLGQIACNLLLAGRRPWRSPEIICEAVEDTEISPLPSATEGALNPGS